MGQPVILEAAYFDAVYELYRYAFHKEPRGGRDALAEFFKQTTVYGEFDDNNQLTSQVTRIPFSVRLGHREIAGNGIGNVASYPEYRGNGAASRLMMQSLQDSYDAGEVISYLAPFSYGFYGRFGYAQVFDHADITWRADDFPQGKRTPGVVERLPFERALEPMKLVYRQADVFNYGAIAREDWWWRYYFSMKTPQTKFAIYRDEEGVAQGYVMYEFSEMTFVIREWVVLTTEALLGLTRFIGSHAGSSEVFTYEAPTADVTAVPVAQLMTEPKYQAVVKPYMQARIVNLEALCQVLELDVPETVAFDVQDETAPWNGGRFELRGGTLERVVQTEAPQLSGSIQAFTQWLLGYKRLSSLLLTGELRTNTPEEFEPVDALLTRQHPVLADYF